MAKDFSELIQRIDGMIDEHGRLDINGAKTKLFKQGSEGDTVLSQNVVEAMLVAQTEAKYLNALAEELKEFLLVQTVNGIRVEPGNRRVELDSRVTTSSKYKDLAALLCEALGLDPEATLELAVEKNVIPALRIDGKLR